MIYLIILLVLALVNSRHFTPIVISNLESNSNIKTEKKITFDDIPDIKVTPTKEEGSKLKETPSKSTLFNFDDADVEDEINKKRSETKLPNKDSGKQSKIKFLFED